MTPLPKSRDPLSGGLQNKTVLITGATGGIGSEMARLFAACGSRVGLHYHSQPTRAQSLKREIQRRSGQAECFQADLADAGACRTLIQAFLARFRRIDVLINNAGAVAGPGPYLDLAEENWDATFALNVKAPFFLAQQAFPAMMRQKGGRIINISSVAAKYGGSSQTLHYGAAKAALEAVTVGLARLGAPHNILVNGIRAGFIDTPFHKKLGRRNLRKRIQMIPLKRAGQPIDVARLAVFLASKSGDFMTGEVLTVSGGD